MSLGKVGITRFPSWATQLPALLYPLGMLLSLATYLAATAAGVTAELGSYIAVVFGAGLVCAMETASPYRSDWRGTAADQKVDLAYMILVQTALPVMLATFAGAWISEQRNLAADAATWTRLWPHSWPLLAQAALMLVCADFLRYWLHVACHRFAPLWRLHAVHHSPTRLYWLNVGRFHPIEKLLQLSLDALPFALLGVSGEVIGAYFVFYAVNGFFQHSNITLRFGWLNYVVSTAELHRWHHSRDRRESCSNYGNNLIVWDLIFGTRRLPRDAEVRALGLTEADYPSDFLGQIKAPFRRRSGPSARATQHFTRRCMMRALMAWLHLSRCRPLLAATRRPERAQAAVLERVLRANEATHFGREHRFNEISDYADFLARVPVQTYETLRPYIERQMRARSPELTVEAPIVYLRTSATTAAPKDVPMTRSALRRHESGQQTFAAFQFAAAPEAYYGRILGIAGPAVEGQLVNGLCFGSASGYFYRNIPRIARRNYVIPWQVFDIADYELKYLLIARLAIVDRDITHLASANPSTFLKLANVIAEHRCQLLADVRAERFHRSAELDDELRALLMPSFKCSATRKRELEQALAQPRPRLAELWPDLRLVSTWTGGSCGIALDLVRAELPAKARIADLGYLASEFRGTVTVDLAQNLAVPMLQDNFYEFVEKRCWDEGRPKFLRVDELRADELYYIIVTTSSGLYRYFINDLVRVNGWVNRTPSLVFVQKGRGVTNITGEKITEQQTIEAVKTSLARHDLVSGFFILLCRPTVARYELLLQTSADVPVDLAQALAPALDEALAACNVEYRAKRASGRLSPATVRLMSTAFADSYKRHCLARGQRECQFKPALLQHDYELDFDYEQFARTK